MPISQQLIRLARNVGALTADTNAIFEALRAKGVVVPANAQLSDVADMIETIEVPITSVEIGGRSYPVVRIGNQLWMAENLDYKFSYNGSTLPIGSEMDPQSALPSIPYGWYYNDNEATYGIDGTYKCGLLYNWYAVKYLEDNKSTLLPNGWHVPTINEWDSLISQVGDSSTAGTKLKAMDASIAPNWPNGWNGTDDFGFSMIPSGMWAYTSKYLGVYGVAWTSSEDTDSKSFDIIFDNTGSLLSISRLQSDALSLRLVKDVT